MSFFYNLPDKEEAIKLFDSVCEQIQINPSKEDISELCIYEMTDGTRTSTELKGEDAYFDGGIFILRFIHILKAIGGKKIYVNVIHEDHKKRANYPEIYMGMKKHVEVYRDYAHNNKIKMCFVGKYDASGVNIEKDFSLVDELQKLEKETSSFNEFTAYFMINFSTKWAAQDGRSFFETLPDANVIVRHTKGYVNGDMWIYGKLDDNTFVYVQNGSSSINWSNRQIIYLIALSLRSMLLNRGTHLFKKYKSDEQEYIRRKREIELSIIHKDFYDPKTEEKNKKRVIIFSPIGPEIYEF